VTDVNASGSVTGESSTGGLIGRIEANVINASAGGDVNGTSGNRVGGLIGAHRPNQAAKITNVSASGDVSASGNGVGGLVGHAKSSSGNPITVSNAHASGAVNATGEKVGGLVGQFQNAGNVTDVSAKGDVNASGPGDGDRVGGLVGNLHHDSADYILANASATGDVDATGQRVGGLIGYNQNGDRVETSYARGNVSTDGNFVGGLIGDMNAGSIIDSYARGDVITSGDKVGGLAGEANGGVTRAYASGRVEGDGTDIGGLVGSNDGTLSDAYWDRGATNQTDATGSGSSGGATGYGTVGDSRALKMQGRAPTMFMSALDYTSPWKLTSTYPVFQRESNTSGSLVAPVDVIKASTATVVQTQQLTVEVNASINGSRVGPGYLITVSDPNGLAELDSKTALTNQNGTATFTFAEPNAGTFEPTFVAVSDSSVSGSERGNRTNLHP